MKEKKSAHTRATRLEEAESINKSFLLNYYQMTKLVNDN